MSVSHWKRATDLERAEPVDTVVIGSGITGLSAAYELCERGQRVLMLERHTLGWGASSRNAGFLMRGLAENYDHCVRTYGRERARTIWTWCEENLALLLDRYQINELDSYQQSPSSIVAMTAEEAEELRNSANLLEEDGFRCELRTSGSDTLWKNMKPEIALENPGDAAINPWELVTRLHEMLLSEHGERVRLIENAEAVGFTPDGFPHTHAQVYPCERVLVCTNAWAEELLPTLGANVAPNRGQMLALRAHGVTLDASYYLHRGSEYIRQTKDGAIILGGKRTHREPDERTTSDAPSRDIQDALEQYARELLQTDFEVVSRWAGTMGFSPDGLPLIAKAEEVPGEVWFVGGLTGHGMSLGVRTAQQAVRCMMENTENPLQMTGG